MRRLCRRAILGLAIGALLASGTARAADKVADFYHGQVLTILIGHPPGGSYDLYAALAARHFSRFVPGHPTVVVQSMPGGAASKAAAYFYAQAPHDGSMIALFPETIAMVQLMDPMQGRWDVTKMRYIGSFAPVNTVFMTRKGSPLHSAQDLLHLPANIGCSGRTSQSYQYPALFKAVTQAKFTIICGYQGSSAYTLALLRNEVDLVSKAWNAWRVEDRDAIANGTLIPLMQGGLKRSPDLPAVPLMQELTTDPQGKQALVFISAGAAIGRALLAPPGIPADRLAALRAAFMQMVQDPDFAADAKHVGALLDPASGADVQAISDQITQTPPAIVAIATKAFEAE